MLATSACPPVRLASRGSSAPSRKKEEGPGGFSRSASGSRVNFGAALAAARARRLVAHGTRVAAEAGARASSAA